MHRYIVEKRFATNYPLNGGRQQVLAKKGDVIELPDAVAATLGGYIRPVGDAPVPAVPVPEPEAEAALVADPEVPVADPEPAVVAELHAMPIADVTQVVDACTTVEELDVLEQQEQANPRHEGGRLGVLRAIAARRAALVAG